jgi:hypothetical protein
MGVSQGSADLPIRNRGSNFVEETPLRQLRRLFLKYHVGLALVALLAIGLAACSTGPSAEPAPKVDSYQGGPRLALDNKSLDFGNVAYNQEVKATFNLKNVGDQPLRIEKVDIKTLEGC